MKEADHEWHDDGPERLYVITGGRSGTAAPEALDLVTLVISRAQPAPGMQPERAAIVRLCRAPLSVAELTAYLRLPFSAVAVLVADLMAEGAVETRSSVPPVADLRLLEEVMDGLEQL
ncbi:DUF742 domain-containing protein [Streptomyces synnematoformans]|uniref:DUF742 domain-containing protein n=1 Tax=Streptomyces synnematoformans TaxID=415721 RepID=A0ABN2A7P3_9ACTN